MLPYSDRKRVQLWLQEALFKAEDEKLLSHALITHIRAALTLEWSDRMSRCIGTARYDHKRKEATIKLSTILWAAAPEAEKRETVYHEFAHILVDVDNEHKDDLKSQFARGLRAFGRQSRRSVHGPEWRYMMHKLGYPNAARCHDVVNEEYERSKGKFPIHCLCKTDPVGWVSCTRAHRLGFCRKCKGPFRIGK